MRTLASLGADVNALDHRGSTPLMHAAELGLADMVALLLELGANPQARNEDADTALHFASTYGSVDAVELLIEAGADIHARNDLGESFLDVSLPRKRAQIIDVLTRH